MNGIACHSPSSGAVGQPPEDQDGLTLPSNNSLLLGRKEGPMQSEMLWVAVAISCCCITDSIG